MAMNPKQKAALFEKLRQTGKLSTMAPHVPMAHPKQLQPPVPNQAHPMTAPPPVTPQNLTNPNKLNGNPNLIGNPQAQKFKKIKSMFGL